MKFIMENYRRFIKEATEHDENLGRILDSGAPQQAIELAASLGVSAKDLPWNYERLSGYLSWRSEKEGISPFDVRAKEARFEEILDELGIPREDWYEMVRTAPAPTGPPPKGLQPTVHLREELLKEATEYDEQFGRLLDSDNAEQAIELAASLGIPAKDLPWTYKRFRRLAASRWSTQMHDEGGISYDEMITKMMDEFGLPASDVYVNPEWQPKRTTGGGYE